MRNRLPRQLYAGNGAFADRPELPSHRASRSATLRDTVSEARINTHASRRQQGLRRSAARRAWRALLRTADELLPAAAQGPVTGGGPDPGGAAAGHPRLRRGRDRERRQLRIQDGGQSAQGPSTADTAARHAQLPADRGSASRRAAGPVGGGSIAGARLTQ